MANAKGEETLREVNQRLAQARQNRIRARELKEKLDEVQGELLCVMGRLRRLRSEAQSEAEDVLELERTTLKSILRSVLGDKEELLAKEMAELEQAEDRVRQCEAVEAALGRRVEKLKARYEKLGDTRGSLRETFKEKEALLLEMEGEAARRLEEFTESRRELAVSGRDIKAALIPGRLAIRALGHVRDELIRHRKRESPPSDRDPNAITPIDNAVRQSERAQFYIRELGDALGAVPGDFENPAHQHYRGVPEWLDHDRTESYVREAVETRRWLRSILADLELHLEKTEKDLDKLKRKRRELIWKA